MRITFRQENFIIVRIESENAKDVFDIGRLSANMLGVWSGDVGDGKYAIHCSPQDLLSLALKACKP